jgi:hypothetical protein
VAWRTEPAADGQFKVRLQVRQEGVPDDFLMYVPVTQGPRSEIELPLMPAEPKKVKLNDLEGVLAEVKTGWE